MGIVAHSREIFHILVLPAVFILLAHSSATLTEACVTYLVAGHQNLSTCLFHGLCHMYARRFGYALIALAVVVGADIEYGMVASVVPAYEFVVLLYEREEVVAAPLLLVPALYLCEQPAA